MERDVEIVESNEILEETDAVGRPGQSGTLPSFAFLPVDRDSETYNMDHPKRGLAYIFNHQHFTVHGLTERTGTDADRDRLSARLQELDFQVRCFDNLTWNEINIELLKLAEEDHSDSDCVVVTVMSHGDEGRIYAKDRYYKAEQLWSYFTSDQCPTLAGKPKIFFIQACQGDQMDPGVTLLPSPMTATDGSCMSYKIPTNADFLIVFSSLPGFASWRNAFEGSWFIQSLCLVLEERGRREDLLSIMTTVSRIVSVNFESNSPTDVTQNKQKQIPFITSLLTRQIFFKPKNKNSKVN
jgi:caspase-like apoptosis-related cysteine protease